MKPSRARLDIEAAEFAPVHNRAPVDTQEQWRRVRQYLNGHRHDLAVRAQELYPTSWGVAGTSLLARSAWIPAAPVPLEHVNLAWCEQPGEGGIVGTERASGSARPLCGDRRRFASYADAMAQLDPPRLFENRTSYRLLDVDVGDRQADLGFARGSYFDVINVCEAVAHEFAARALAARDFSGIAWEELPFRSLIGDPTDLARRPVMPAVSVLVIRRQPSHNIGTFLLHWRDPAKVASGGGLYQVTPVGMFQPSTDAPCNEAHDFDLWRLIVREFSEELLGASEDYASDLKPIDYDRWPLYCDLTTARHDGSLKLFWLGLGIDPLTLVADLLVAAVFDADRFDSLFPRLASTNDEGRLVGIDDLTGAPTGLPFTHKIVERYATAEPMQPAGAGLLQLAWQHRGALLGS